MNTIKQVIVMRDDLGMRRGKQIAQGSHATMAFLTKALWWPAIEEKEGTSISFLLAPGGGGKTVPVDTTGYAVEATCRLSAVQRKWVKGLFTKICVRISGEHALLDIKAKAEEAGLECHLITDSGATEFHGIPTMTCLAIGPDYADKIDPITGHLKLL